MPTEQVGEAELLSVRIAESIVLRFPARGQRATLRGDPLYLPAKLDLLGEKPGARIAIFGALIGKGLASLSGEFGGRYESFRRGHRRFPLTK